jgi:hypothetical protein
MAYSSYRRRHGIRFVDGVSLASEFWSSWDWLVSVGAFYMVFVFTWTTMTPRTGQTASEWWSWELVGRKFDLWHCCLVPNTCYVHSIVAASLWLILSFVQHGPCLMLSPQIRTSGSCDTVSSPRICFDDLPGSFCTRSCSLRSVCIITTNQTKPVGLTVSIYSIGNLLGEHKANRAGVAANTSIVLGVMIALFWSMLLLIFRKSWAHMFNNDPGAMSFLWKYWCQ